MDILTKLKQFIHYLWGKRSELTGLDEKDLLLSKVVLEIHHTRTSKTTSSIDLFALHPVHPINRPNSISDTQKRISTLEQVREELCQARHLSRALLQNHLPSVSGIKVVRQGNHAIAFEGSSETAMVDWPPYKPFSAKKIISALRWKSIFSQTQLTSLNK